MIFRRNKPAPSNENNAPVMRGRHNKRAEENPLARRFHPADEPDTIDLLEGEGFGDEPGTTELAAKSATAAAGASHVGIVSMVTETGKFYVQPGQGENVIYLGDEPVLSVTELRPGDRIRAGNVEFSLLRQGEK